MDFTGKEAIILKDYLILADVHLGYEIELLKKGINVPDQTEKTIKKVEEIQKEYSCKKLIIVGDLKHNVPKISLKELKAVPYFLNKMKEFFQKIYVIKGNHDGKIQEIVPEGIKVLKELKIGPYVFTHGHRKPILKGKIYVIGHNHPVYPFNFYGETFCEKVFVYGQTEEFEVLILPAFSDLVGGTEVGNFNGPIAKKIKEFSVLSLDGTVLE